MREDGPVLAGGSIYYDKNVLNILLIGTDERAKHFSDNARADSMLLMSLHMKNKTVKLASLERAIGVPVPGREDDWLTHVFRYGGADLLLKTVRDCFKLDVTRYVRVNFGTFEKIVDSIGGVDITLTQLEAKALNNEVYTNAIANTRVKTGLNHLSGYNVLQYSRLRFIDSDWRRVERQRTTIQAMIDQTKSLSLPELNELLDVALPLVRTNFTQGELSGLVLKAPRFLGAKTAQKTIPEKGTYWGYKNPSGRSLFGIDFEKNSAALREFFYGKDALSSTKN